MEEQPMVYARTLGGSSSSSSNDTTNNSRDTFADAILRTRKWDSQQQWKLRDFAPTIYPWQMPERREETEGFGPCDIRQPTTAASETVRYAHLGGDGAVLFYFEVTTMHRPLMHLRFVALDGVATKVPHGVTMRSGEHRNNPCNDAFFFVAFERYEVLYNDAVIVTFEPQFSRTVCANPLVTQAV
jgi:hypothetical protein